MSSSIRSRSSPAPTHSRVACSLRWNTQSTISGSATSSMRGHRHAASTGTRLNAACIATAAIQPGTKHQDAADRDADRRPSATASRTSPSSAPCSIAVPSPRTQPEHEPCVRQHAEILQVLDDRETGADGKSRAAPHQPGTRFGAGRSGRRCMPPCSFLDERRDEPAVCARADSGRAAAKCRRRPRRSTPRRAPHASAMAIALGRASLKLSISDEHARETEHRHERPRRRWRAIRLPENLQRHHRLAARSGARLEGHGAADRQREIQRRQHVQPEIELPADVADRAADRGRIEIRDQPAREQRRPHPGQVEARRARARGNAPAADSTRPSTSTKLRPPISLISAPGSA